MDPRLRRDLHDELTELAWVFVVVIAAVALWLLCLALAG